MRKNSPRKWLHACLDLLPVILIPVFMIYSHRHEINNGSIQVQEKKVIDFNQKVINPNFDDNYGGFNRYNFTWSLLENGGVHLVSTSEIFNQFYTYFDVIPNHIYLGTFNIYSYSSSSVYSRIGNSYGSQYVVTPNNSYKIQQRYKSTQTYLEFNFFIPSNVVGNSYDILSANFVDLTQMYGEGNEPSIDDYNSQFSSDYYPYVVSDKQFIDGDLVIYNDTDIMSQFTYQLYNSVDKYFNMGNVFNMNGVYDWFNLNIFNGSAPIYIYVVWQIVLYEFVMDLLFLLYGLFMWFIDMVQYLMDKPFKSIK